MKKAIFIIGTLFILSVVIGIWYINKTSHPLLKAPIKVGILHSLSGTMAISEAPVAEATLMAIDEINKKGGLLGRPIEPIVVDGQSNWPHFADMAEKLITQDNVSVIFGCWTSACRKTVKPIIEKHHHLLFYPVQYEGLEQSPNIVYTGAAPNQQIIPAVKWSFDHLGKRFFLVGSDYVFPRTANEIIKEQIKILGGEVVGEEYLLLGSQDIAPIIKKILETKPDVILNTINGDSNIAFFKALREAGITPKEIPVMSFSIGESELSHMNKKDVAGHYAAWNYFQSIPTPENKDFVSRFKKTHKNSDNTQTMVVDDPMEAGYFGVYLWAQAVNDAKSNNVNDVLSAIKSQSFYAPEGVVYVDPDVLHTWRSVRIGKIGYDGQFEIVWSSERPIEPVPYPTFRSKEEWNEFLDHLYTNWKENWENTGK